MHETYIPTSNALDIFFDQDKQEDIKGGVTDGSMNARLGDTIFHDVNAVHGTGILVADTNTNSLTQLQTNARMVLANKTNSLPPDSLGAFIHRQNRW